MRYRRRNPSLGLNMIEILEEHEALLAEGFQAALIGYTNGSNIVAVYDFEICVNILQADGMDRIEAVEYMDFNLVGAYVGEKSPIFITIG